MSGKRLAFGLAMLLTGAAALSPLAGCAPANENVQVNAVDIPVEGVPSLRDVGTVSVKQELTDGHETYRLTATFDDPDAALENVRDQAADAVRLLESRNPWLGPFSSWNWAAYQDVLNGSFDDLCDGSDLDDQLWMLLQFFDYYENDGKNAEIVDRAQREGLDAVWTELPDQ